MSTPIDEIIRVLEKDPADLLGTEEVRAPEVFDAWIRRCATLVSVNPEPGLPHVDTALKIAETKCQVVQSLGLEASALSSLHRFDAAILQFELAFRLATGCAACGADLVRRRAFFHGSRGEKDPALADAEAAVLAYQELSRPRHSNLRNNGLGTALHTRGDIRQFFGVPGALEDFSEALRLADPAVSPELYFHCLVNLGVVLREEGGLENLLTANEHIREAWKRFRRRGVEASRERAHLDWQTAMVRFELRRHDEGKKKVSESPSMLRRKMKRAIADFLELNMPAEAAAVAADLALLAFPMRMLVAEVIEDAANRIKARLAELGGEVEAKVRPVLSAMDAVCLAADGDVMAMSSLEFNARMRATIERLREVCANVAGATLLPCLLTWPSVE